MIRCGFIFLLLTLSTWGQTGAVPASPTQTQNNQKPDTIPALGEFPADKVPQDAIIVTITGLCPHPKAAKTPADCKTTFTRAEFERILNVMKPDSPQPVRRMFAMSYGAQLVKEQKALEMGLEKRPDFPDRVEVERLLVTHETLDDLQGKKAWDAVSDRQIEDYYRQNPKEFVQVDALRIFVPWFEPDENKTLPDAEKLKADLEWQRKLREEADKLHARALAGEDFVELQREAYKFTDVSSDVDIKSITLPRTRRLMLTQPLMPMMDLEPGQITPVLVEDNGYYFFKATKKVSMPFDERTIREIHSKFRDEQLQKDQQELVKVLDNSVTYNDNYFGPPPPKENAQTSPGYDVMPVAK